MTELKAHLSIHISGLNYTIIAIQCAWDLNYNCWLVKSKFVIDIFFMNLKKQLTFFVNECTIGKSSEFITLIDPPGSVKVFSSPDHLSLCSCIVMVFFIDCNEGSTYSRLLQLLEIEVLSPTYISLLSSTTSKDEV